MSDNPTFEQRDARHPAFWSERFEKNFTPWDKGGVPAQFAHYFQPIPPDPSFLCLIPGCGNGYEAVYLSELGWDVAAIDFSPSAVASAHALFPAWRHRIIEADFFCYQPKKKPCLIYERAFFCALPPEMRSKIVSRWAELLPVGALLVGYFYIAEEKSRGGPPFSITSMEFNTLMSPHFACLEDNAVDDSLSVFKSGERWQVWKKVA